MPQELSRSEILENLNLLSEWLRVKYPGETFELMVVGGAAMALSGFKDQTRDIDLLRPERLPASLKAGIAHISEKVAPGMDKYQCGQYFKESKAIKNITRLFQ